MTPYNFCQKSVAISMARMITTFQPLLIIPYKNVTLKSDRIILKGNQLIHLENH